MTSLSKTIKTSNKPLMKKGILLFSEFNADMSIYTDEYLHVAIMSKINLSVLQLTYI